MSSISKRKKEGSRTKIKSVGDHKEFLTRITKTLYYGQLPSLPCLSLPVTELSCEVWSAAQRGRSLRRLRADAAADLARHACVSPCALVLALLYLERLHQCNRDYLVAAPPHHLFLVSLMVGNKFLQDDGEDDEVICAEWAASGGIDIKQLNNLEMEFLNAIDWNVFVSEKSFEAGLAWLERQVAVRQASARGFYTYSDLAAARAGGGGELARAAAAAVAALAAGYVAALAALLASALAAGPAWLAVVSLVRPALTPASVPLTPTPTPATNVTVDTQMLLDATEAAARLTCCAEWTRRLDTDGDTHGYRDWTHTDISWWPTAPLEWLHRGSAADPMRRWLQRMDEYSDGRGPPPPPPPAPASASRLQLGGLGALLTAVSDR